MRALAQIVPLLFVAAFVALVHHIPHLPGPAADSPLDAYGALWDRVGPGDPHPLHVDEHYHLAHMAQVDRTGLVEVPDPYTGEPPETALLSVPGMRSERGWDIAVLQVSHLTGASLPTLVRFMPAAWAGFLAVLVYAAVRPAPGALASAAAVAIIPTTVRMLGPGFLVPSAFALPWVVAAAFLVLRGDGPGRYVGIVLVVTGAFLMHLVMGVLALAAGVVAALASAESSRGRAALTAATLVPLAWIVPPNWIDARQAVASEHALPFEAGIFWTAGIVVLLGAALGAAAAWLREDTRLHRVAAVLAVGTALSMAWSVANEHHSDATYSRLVPTFFLSIAVLFGLGAATASRWIARVAVPRIRPATAAVVCLALVAAALTQPLQVHLATPYYRVFDDGSWQAGQDLLEAGIGPGETFLAHPWRSPVYAGLTGALPHSYLLPGAPPVAGDDYARYLGGSLPAAWYEEHGIDAAVGPVRPPGFEQVAPGVYLAP